MINIAYINMNTKICSIGFPNYVFVLFFYVDKATRNDYSVLFIAMLWHKSGCKSQIKHRLLIFLVSENLFILWLRSDCPPFYILVVKVLTKELTQKLNLKKYPIPHLLITDLFSNVYT